MMHTKRRPNNGMNGNMNGNAGGGNGQQRGHTHNNNRPRRFGNAPRQGGDDNASVTRTRRAATQSREKYQMMARDALSMGDRVLAENYLQHADHYHRVLNALPPEDTRQHHPRPQHVQDNDGQEQYGESGQEQASQTPDTHGAGLPAFITQSQEGEE